MQKADSLLSISDDFSDCSQPKKQIQTNYQLALIRRFDFSSKLQRMSVIVKSFLDQSFKAFVKGSPERVRELCKLESLPKNFDEILEKYTECGYRVLALAVRDLPQLSYLKS
jgi:cation-transporting ATPase 13A2